MRTIFWTLSLTAMLIGGCEMADPETRLYQAVARSRSESQPWTIYNYPCIYLTSKEQQVRAEKQRICIRNHVEVGMTDKDFVGYWGRPNDIKKSTYPGGTFDTFIYESTGGRYMPISHYYFVFRDKKLESWHRA